MERKSLKDISWQVDESTYRADPALSYSILARYEREGFNNLDKLFDRIETPSLIFGSCVDTFITGSEEEFNKLFMVAEFDNNLSDTDFEPAYNHGLEKTLVRKYPGMSIKRNITNL